MNGTLRVTPEKMLSISGQFGQSNGTVKNLTSQMLAITGALSSTWAGEAATAYYNKLKGLEPDMNRLYRMIQEHTTDLADMAKTYQNAEKANLQTANALQTNQIP